MKLMILLILYEKYTLSKTQDPPPLIHRPIRKTHTHTHTHYRIRIQRVQPGLLYWGGAWERTARIAVTLLLDSFIVSYILLPHHLAIITIWPLLYMWSPMDCTLENY